MTHRGQIDREDSTPTAILKQKNLYFLVVGLAALIWFLIRVIPKPSRASYPCMKIAISLASGWVLHVLALTISVVSLHGARKSLQSGMAWLSAILILVAVTLPVSIPGDVQTAPALYQAIPQAPNQPIGRAVGIYPGRVVWIHDPASTNKNCNPSLYGHGWFLPENTDQVVIDRMLSEGLQTLTGQTTDTAAWNSIFRFHNTTRGKGAVGYKPGEKIFIKINATSSWSGNINQSDFTKVNNSYYGISETSPPLVLSMLRQLIDSVGVAQTDIWIGDPMRHIYKHCYDLWHAEFRNVHYLDHDGWNGREKPVASATALIKYSDRGKTLHSGTSPVVEDQLYSVFETAEYLINIPMLKGHKYAGITAFAKDHFGSQTRDGASHLHNGLVAPDQGDPMRSGYGLYRVQVDLLSHRLTGVKNLLYLMDALWSTDMELDPPVKWMIPPFNNNWTSSLFVSLDPVAIESVGFDFLLAEFTPSRGLATFVQMDGVDDYLHQAADSTTWPSGIEYDPENDGQLISSLGTHEHWNNVTEKKYSRDLHTGSGIELVQISHATGVGETAQSATAGFKLCQNYPNPFNPTTVINYFIAGTRGQGMGVSDVRLVVHDLLGREVAVLVNERKPAGSYEVRFDGAKLSSGVYIYRLTAGNLVQSRKMVLTK
jgi:hypothetical protein